jgi:hypothetical protein
MGFGEVSRDVLEADLWPAWFFLLQLSIRP